MDKSFLVSVIMPVYNTEKYVEKSILSVIKQTIGFEKNIQLIIVNNASEDDSDLICRRYADMYPDNIDYIVLEENRGPGGGRNAGIPFVKGKYVNFFDSDDLWGSNAFKAALSFFEENYEEIDVVSCRIKNFDAQGGFHALDYKWKLGKENRIIDLKEESSFIQMHITPTFIKSDIVKSHMFDETIIFAEDSMYINHILIEKLKYGLVNQAEWFFYRRRSDKSSMQNSKDIRKETFDQDIKLLFNSYINRSQDLYGEVIPYVQWLMMYEIGWRLTGRVDVLTPEELSEYKALLISYLKLIDDEVILGATNLYREYKAFALKLKHGDNFLDNMNVKALRRLGLFSPYKPTNFSVEMMEIENGRLILEGRYGIILDKSRWRYFLKERNGEKYTIEEIGGDQETTSLGETILKKYGFSVSIDITSCDRMELVPCVQIDGKEYEGRYHFGEFSRVSNYIDNSYYCVQEDTGKYGVTFEDDALVVVQNPDESSLENKLQKELLSKKKRKIAIYRRLANYLKKRKKKKLWLISDRMSSADDNGEFFFNWLRKSEYRDDIDYYYVIDRKSKDYKRLLLTGKVIKFGTWRYKLKYLTADAIVTSMLDRYILNLPFGWDNKFLRDLQPKRFFLGHGTVDKDISEDQGKFKRNFRIYTVSSPLEYKYFLEYNYGYTEKEIKLTGTSRQDVILRALEGWQKKGVYIAPTWRYYLTGKYHNGKRQYFEGFTESEYFNFFNSLINNPRLLDCMRNEGYHGVFNIHPTMTANIGDFVANDVFKVVSANEPYQSRFANNNILVTDYSSIAHDFAYAGKYVIYAQFDEDDFYSNHTYTRGFLDYETEGFGPLCRTIEETVDAIIEAITCDAKVDEKYAERTHKFFSYFDGKSCERIYKELIQVE